MNAGNHDPRGTLSGLAASLGELCVDRVGDAVVTGVRHDSREVSLGDLFVCIRGGQTDGHRFIADAKDRGAVGYVVDHAERSRLASGAPALIVTDTRRALALCAAEVYGRPSHAMRVVAVTGTNGKTTTAAMVAAIARAAGLKPGRIGTLGAEALGRELPCAHTTPEADDLQRIMSEMRAMGVEVLAMEASSHGLALNRTDGIAVSAGVFTNLTQDHLDYHHDLDDYFQAKLRLFAEYPRWSNGEFTGIVNMDDPRGDAVVEATDGRVITFATARPADLQASGVIAHPRGTEFVLEGACGRLPITLPIGGVFQVANALGAIGASISLGMDSNAIVEGLSTMPPVPGRFESVQTGRGWDVIVDFAHTPAGIESLLHSARALNPDRIILVVGCGGDRDRGKRPIIGKLAGTGADIVVVTSDNPRHEDPEAIIKEILAGMGDATAAVIVEPDRREAIRLAMEAARPGDLLLIAGKGGETVTIVGDERIPYDDRLVVREILEAMQ